MSQRKHISGTQYSWEKKNGKVVVFVEKTAQGQTTVVGTYDPKAKIWQNNRRKIAVPNNIRRIIESACESTYTTS